MILAKCGLLTINDIKLQNCFEVDGKIIMEDLKAKCGESENR